MNKKQLLRIKKAMCYEDVPEQKRTLRQIKKQYKALSDKEKSQFIKEVEEYFALKNK
jgi:hypothetical protein